MKKIKESQVFKPLKEAIESVMLSYDDWGFPRSYVDEEFALVKREDLRILKLVYNEFFVEPEDDAEWNEYQSK